jgi:hypothetical protein
MWQVLVLVLGTCGGLWFCSKAPYQKQPGAAIYFAAALLCAAAVGGLAAAMLAAP